MQTIKTAAVVVLILTVMYGGYNSLNTRPDPVPAEFAGLLDIEDSLGIESGISETLAGVQSASGEIMGDANSAFENAVSSLSADSGTFGQNGSPTQLQSPNTFQDQPSFDGSSQALSRGSTPVQNVSVDLNRNYPATQGTFQLPSSTESSDFDPNLGHAFAGSEQGTSDGVSLPAMDSLPSMDTALTELGPAGSNTASNAIQNSMPVNLGSPSLESPTMGAPSAGFARELDSETKNLGLENAFKTADRQYANDQLSEALATLSMFYDAPNATADQREQLLSRLDPLARSVIYSKRHLVQQPHRVGANETLMEVAAKYKVPWQLLANINGIQDPLIVMPGTELKVIQGPFTAQVDMAAKELTIFVGDMYAGRFPIEIGQSPAPSPGTFTILDKKSNRTYFDASGVAFPPGSPENPYGSAWMDLGNQLCIHGSPSPDQPTNNGCISLAEGQAKDLFGILSLGSSVTIR